ncbi:MAG: hypothetical protein WD671_12220, partial [Parvibaculum sp.]
MGERAATDAKPHYLGHRERLRARFLKAPDSLADYELLELILCNAISRRDVKAEAKALITRFGSLAAVLNADPAQLGEFKWVKARVVAELRLAREAGLRLSQ